MKIYLDHNLIVYLRNNSNRQLNEKVDAMKKCGDEFIFSPAHLEEIAVSIKRYGEDEAIIDKDIDFLTELCGKNSLRAITRYDVLYGSEYPRTCYKRVIDQYELNDHVESVEERVIRDANENPLGDPKQMNNIAPEEILNDRRNKEILLLFLKKNGLMTCLEGEECMKTFPEIKLKVKDNLCQLQYSVNFAANFLERIGYYRENAKRSRSRLHDVSHIVYGRYSDIFVTNDTKLLNKARAIYYFLDVDTKVLTLEEFIQYEVVV